MKKMKVILAAMFVFCLAFAMFACDWSDKLPPESTGESESSGEQSGSEPLEDEIVFEISENAVELYIKPEGSTGEHPIELQVNVTTLTLNGEPIADPQLVWQSADEGVATVADGLIKAAGAGSTVVTVTYTPAAGDPVVLEVAVNVQQLTIAYKVRTYVKPWAPEGEEQPEEMVKEETCQGIAGDSVAVTAPTEEPYNTGYIVDTENSVLSGVLEEGTELILEIHLIQQKPIAQAPELSGEGVTEIPVSGNLSMIPDCAPNAEINEDGPYMRYRSKTSDKTAWTLRFKIDSIPEAVTPDDYIVFAMNYSDTTNMHNGEGFWFINFNNENYEWSSYDEDCHLCTKGNYIKDVCSIAVGKDTKPDKWYYYMCDIPNHTAAAERTYAAFYSPFDILIGHIYAVTPEARERLFGIPVSAVEISMKESLSLETEESKTLGASAANTGYPLTYQSSDVAIATVDADGMVTGVAEGECDITAKIERPGKDTVQKVCHVTVSVPVPPLELSGEGITEIGLDKITYDPAGFDSKIDLQIDGKGYLHYKNQPEITGIEASSQKGGFKINNDDEAIKAEDYMVFVLKYSDDTELIREGTTGTYTGVWFSDWQNSKGGYNCDYLSFDGEFNNCSGDGYVTAPLDYDKTKPETWYYVMSPTTGHHVSVAAYDNYYGSFYGDFHLTIAHVYAVSKDIRDAIIGGYYNKDIISAEKKLVMELNAEQTLNAAVKQLGDTAYTLTYLSDNESVATVTDEGMVKAVGVGNCTITISAEGLDSVSCEIEVVSPALPDISGVEGVTLFTATEGTPLLTLMGEPGDLGRLEQDPETKYWHYWADATSNDGSTRVSLANVNVPDGEYLVLLCKFAAGTKQNGGLWPETILASTNGERYHAVFDEDGYDYTTYDGGNLNKPWGTATLDANKWYFFVDGLRGDLAKFGSYYAPFDFTIANVYSVTQEARDRLFNVNIHKGDTIPEPELKVDSTLSIPAKLYYKQNFARLLYAGKEAPALRYSSSDESIAIVDKYGFIDAKEAGTCTITVITEIGGETQTRTCEVTVLGPRDISGIEGVRVLSEADADPLLVMDETNGFGATVKKDEATGYWLHQYTGTETGGTYAFKETQMKVAADVHDDEFIVYQVLYTRTNVNKEGFSYPTMLDGATYLKGYDREGKSLGANVTPPGPYLWHFLVLPKAGNQAGAFSYYPQFEYYISDVYAVTQAGLDALFHN